MIGKRCQTRCCLKILCGIALLIMIMSCSRHSEEGSVPVHALKNPVTILVLTPGSKESCGAPDRELEGVLLAHAMMPVVANTPIELSIHRSDCAEGDGEGTLDKLLADELPAGVIICGVNPQEWPIDHGSFPAGIPVMIPSWTRVFPDEHQGGLITHFLASSLKEQARSAAVYIALSLKVKRVTILFDERQRDSVMLASLFAPQMISAGGTIVDIFPVDQDGLHTGVLDRILKNRPEAVYLPHSPGFTQMALALLAKAELPINVVVSSVDEEEVLLRAGLTMPRSVYLITEYHADAVQAQHIHEFMQRYRKQHVKGTPSVRVMRGAEAYFHLADSIRKGVSASESSPVEEMSPGQQSVLRLPGEDDHGAGQKPLHVGRVRTRILRDPILEYVETIQNEVSDPGGDIRTQ